MVVDGPFQHSNQNSERAQTAGIGNSHLPTEFYLAQQQLYDDLLEAVRKLPPVEALAEFESTFFGHSNSLDADVSPFLYKILFADNEIEFRNTLKRACYIFVNNWDLAREG